MASIFYDEDFHLRQQGGLFREWEQRMMARFMDMIEYNVITYKEIVQKMVGFSLPSFHNIYEHRCL